MKKKAHPFPPWKPKRMLPSRQKTLGKGKIKPRRLEVKRVAIVKKAFALSLTASVILMEGIARRAVDVKTVKTTF